MKDKILLIDNFDSFTFNLKHLLEISGNIDVVIKRNDEDFLSEIDRGVFKAVIIGPGPGSPDNSKYFGNCSKVILEYGTRGLPIFGICLGFQGIITSFGGHISKAKEPVHGKISNIQIVKESKLFNGIYGSFSAMRYHSLKANIDSKFPNELEILAEVNITERSVKVNGKEIMAIKHKMLPIYGIQFHPESFGTPTGIQIMKNFLKISNECDYPSDKF